MPRSQMLDTQVRQHPPRTCDSAPAWRMPLPVGAHVGPAQILRLTDDGQPLLRLSDSFASEVQATWALPFHYEPEVGDMAWVIGLRGAFYVLGILQGRGRSRMVFRESLSLRAGGSLRLCARRRLRIHGKHLSLRAKAYEVVARRIHEKCGDALRVIRGLTELRAGQSHRVVDDEDNVTARQVTIFGAERVTFDGEVIQVQ